MGQTANLLINFNDSEITECGGRIFEITDTSYEPGKRITFRIWGVTDGLIRDVSLKQGCGQSLGSGKWGTLWNSEYTETLSFDNTNKVQLTYPMAKLLNTVAESSFVSINEEGESSCISSGGGSVNRGHFYLPSHRKGRSNLLLSKTLQKIGNSCIGVKDETIKLSGTVKVRYNRAPFYKSWYWTPPNRTADYWFYIYDGQRVIHSFKISITGTDEDTSSEFREVTLHISDWVSEASLDGASIYIDGNYKGLTDSEGKWTWTRAAVGYHTIKIVKSGYVNSDEDDLDNDEFVVE